LKQTWVSWNNHNAPRIGAALAFYSLLSLAPLVILALATGAFLFGSTATETRLIEQVRSLAGPDGARVVKSLAEQSKQGNTGTLASLIGLATILFGASGIFTELRSALNTIWGVPPKEHDEILELIRQRLLSIGMVVALGFLLVVSLLVSMTLALIGKSFTYLLSVPPALLETVNFLFSFFGIAIMFALIFRYASDARIPWRDVWISAVVTSLLFTLGKMLIGFYLGRAAIGSAYGASGSLVVVIVWVYYSAQIFLFGAEFTRIHSQT